MADSAHNAAESVLEGFTREIQGVYSQAQRKAQKNLDEFLETFAEDDAIYREMLEAGDITKREYKEWRQSKIFMSNRLENTLNEIARAYTNANETAVAILNGKLPEVYAENANYGAFQACEASGLNLSFDLLDADTVQHMLTHGEDLYTPPALNVPKSMQWSKKLMTSQLTQGLMLGEGIPKLSRRIQNVTNSNYKIATRTARTSITGAQNAGRVNSYKRAEAMGVKLKQEWLATLDTRTRHSHRRLDGERVEVGQKFSNGCRYPADPLAPYAEVMNCRCTLIAALDGVSDEAHERFSRLPNGMTYEGWKGLASVEVDELTPCLRRLSDNKIVDTYFEPVNPKKINLSNWQLKERWRRIQNEGYTVEGLYAEGDERVQGLIAYEDLKDESAVYVALVESAPHNNSYNNAVEGKEYNGVGAHLFAEAVKKSYELGYNGFIGFQAKTNLIDYYSKTLGAAQAGHSQLMTIDETAARRLYERYYGNKGL